MLDALVFAGIEWCSTCSHYNHFWICDSVTGGKKQFWIICEECKQGTEISEAVKNGLFAAAANCPSRDRCSDIWNALRKAMVEAASPRATDQANRTAEIDAVRKAGQALLRTQTAEDINYVMHRFAGFMTGLDPTKRR